MENQLTQQEHTQQLKERRKAISIKLAELIVNKDKQKYSAIIRDFMPNGVPNYIALSYAPSLKSLINEISFEHFQAVICCMIDDLCESFSFKEEKKMNESQVIECAAFLLEECKDYRLEDYACMFTMAKRNKLVVGDTGRVFDRIDIQLISQFKSNYDQLRQEEIKRLRISEEKRIEEMEFEKRKDLPNRWPDVLEKWKEYTKEANEEREKRQRIEKEEAEMRRKEIFERMHADAVKNGYDINLFNPDIFGNK